MKRAFPRLRNTTIIEGDGHLLEPQSGYLPGLRVAQVTVAWPRPRRPRNTIIIRWASHLLEPKSMYLPGLRVAQVTVAVCNKR